MTSSCSCYVVSTSKDHANKNNKESGNSLENNEKSNKNLNQSKKSDEKTLTDIHNTENKDSNEKNRKTTTEKKNNAENKDTKEDKNVKKKNTESNGGEENKEIKKKDKESENKGKEGKNKSKGNNSPREKSKICILRDSVIKKLNGYFLKRKVRHKYLIKVRSFSGAKISCMVDHVKPTLRDDKPDHIILHVGTNDLRTETILSPYSLVLMCEERNIPFISHSESIDCSQHLNESKLHLNFNGVKVFTENVSAFLTKFD